MMVEARSWSKVREQTEQLLNDPDANDHGKLLLLGLVELHRREPQLGASDIHFAHELRRQLECDPEPFHGQFGDWVGFFTDGFRKSLVAWSLTPNEPLTSVVDRVFALLDPLVAVRQRAEWAEHAAAGNSAAQALNTLEHS